MGLKMLLLAIVFCLFFAGRSFSNESVRDHAQATGDVKLRFYGSFECGYTDNRALYATFGYEKQLFTCSQAVIGVEGNRPWLYDDSWGQLIFRLEFAPIYNSIKTLDKRKDGMVKLDDASIRRYQNEGLAIPADGEIRRLTYRLIRSPLGNGKTLEIDGSSEYVNWYKNQGSRLYYLEDNSLREMYLGWISENRKHRILTGRMKNLLSFDEQEMIWKEDAWFAPMSYWISNEIYSGIRYSLGPIYGFILDFAIFSGDGNPTKNGIYYINNSGSPNKKTNNTPILEFNLSNSIRLSDFTVGTFFGMEHGTIGSTWDIALGEGKHNRNILATGIDLKYHLASNPILDGVRVFFQYTRFTSGLKEKSSQNSGHPAFKDIVQSGFFVGVDLVAEYSHVFEEVR
ncbi:MAG: hypothetical protein LBI70_02995, partial [Rickettsiales bacterium]|nr:hypothetical protein [Rickettsiales bacterium]